ncbi:MAG: TRAP transporter large permease subunit [Gammaproteobacteria bacterium]|nr:TRAP transporter large permease subunit [Gammaproteobacteria bacterium]
MELGYNPIWWGVVLVMVIEVGMITPPIGMNVFVLFGVASMSHIFNELNH